MESNKEILKRIEEEKVKEPFQEIIEKMEIFLELKKEMKKLEDSKFLAANKETYELAEKELSLVKKDLKNLTQSILKYFKEDKKEYSFDEIETKLKELYKKQYEIKRQIDSN